MVVDDEILHPLLQGRFEIAPVHHIVGSDIEFELFPGSYHGRTVSEFPPHHLIDYPDVALDDLDDLGADVLVRVVGDGDAV